MMNDGTIGMFAGTCIAGKTMCLAMAKVEVDPVERARWEGKAEVYDAMADALIKFKEGR